MIVFVWLLNFSISILNAWGCGKSWTETKAVGKFPHLLNWCGAIMSAIGFTWCYLIIAGWAGYTIPFDHKVHGVTVNSPYFDEKDLSFLFDMGYAVIIVPLIGSGMVITVNSWCVAWRNRTFGDGAIATYNTFAMYNNIYSAVTESAGVFGRISSYSKSSSSSSDSDDKKGYILLLVVFCFIGGVLTTKWIIKKTQLATAQSRQYQYESFQGASRT